MKILNQVKYCQIFVGVKSSYRHFCTIRSNCYKLLPNIKYIPTLYYVHTYLVLGAYLPYIRYVPTLYLVYNSPYIWYNTHFVLGIYLPTLYYIAQG